MNDIDKQTYITIVKVTLKSMMSLAKENKDYNLVADTINYYETTIRKENEITLEEFLELCKEVGIQ